MMIVDEKYAKLPKYAQEEILRLQRIVSDLQQALREQQQTTPSKIQWGSSYHPNHATGYLDNDEVVSYQMSDRPRTHIRVRLDKDGLKINGDSRLSIVCESSNCFTVTERP